jgi:hypothetical protein
MFGQEIYKQAFKPALFFAQRCPGMLHNGFDRFFCGGTEPELIKLLYTAAQYCQPVPEFYVLLQCLVNSGMQLRGALFVQIQDKILFPDFFHNTIPVEIRGYGVLIKRALCGNIAGGRPKCG